MLTWHGDNGQKVISTPIEENTKQWEALCKVRESLVGDLADNDESIADIVLNSESIDKIDSDTLLSAVRRVCVSQVCYSKLSNYCCYKTFIDITFSFRKVFHYFVVVPIRILACRRLWMVF